MRAAAPIGSARRRCRTKRLTVQRARPGAAARLRPAAPPAAARRPPPPPRDPARQKPDGRHSLRAPVTGENFYFVMADRFENGDASNDHGGLAPGKVEGTSGFDPTGKGWYHGGDLKGLTSRIDYIQDLGTTAIWLTPSFKNKAVQDNAGFPSAGYHGYWVTDFTQIDPHLGTNDDLRALVDAAHARGMKVYFDIITNHTADVITYTEGAAPAYVSKDEEPYRTAAGAPFDDRDYAGTSSFPRAGPDRELPVHAGQPARRRHARQPEPQGPEWLNDVTAYHNRGNTTFTGENSFYGDFFGLDDLFTEQPRVVDGMIDIYNTWIRDFRIDGFRIDTMKHVDDEFWRSVRAGDAGDRALGRQGRLLRLRRGLRPDQAVHVALHDAGRRPGRARLPVPARGAGLRRAVDAGGATSPSSSAATTGTPTRTRTSTSCRRSSETTTWAASGSSCARATPAPATPRSSRATASATSSCTSRAATPSSTTATSRASSATAATSSRARTCSTARSPSTTTTT